MRETSQLHIDLSAVDQNIRVVRRIVGAECAICPIVKADAYGMGAARLAKQLVDSGADMLAVYTPEQASELARAGIAGAPVLVLMPVSEITRVDELYRWLICGQLHLTVHDPEHLRALTALAERFGAVIPIHLEIDSGMCRGGCTLEEAPGMLGEISRTRWLHLAGVFTHFAKADADVEFTDRQLARFNQLIDAHAPLIPPDCLLHVANTFALLRHGRFHKSMVRVGLAWAGYGLECLQGGEILAAGEDLQPILTWSSRIVQVKTVPPGTKVGYGSKWTSKRPSLIGLVPVGYADGYPIGSGATDARPSGSRVAVIVPLQGSQSVPAPKFVPVVGAVNMDQMTIDLTDLMLETGRLPEGVGVGCTVELISPRTDAPNHLPAIAAAAGTIPTEMMCRLNPRIRRTYHATPGAKKISASSAVVAG